MLEAKFNTTPVRLIRDPGCGGPASALADSLLASALIGDGAEPGELELRCGEHGLWLRLPGPRPLNLHVDFVHGRQGYRLARAAHAREDLVRALGRLPAGSVVADASAGLGRDAVVLAARGFRVLACERHPVLAALLADALARAREVAALRPVVDRIELVASDVREALGSQLFDAAMFDPMFPARGKDAAVKKEMQILQRLFGADSDADAPETLGTLRRQVRRRVVVKRPLHAPPLGDETPAHSLRGRSTRFDVYLPLPAGG